MITLIHGFNVKDPEKTVGKLRPYLDDAKMFDYGWFGLISVLLKNKKEAKKLKKRLDLVNDDNIVYGHSNGCAIAVEAARKGAKIKTLICINPALKRKTVFPKSIDRILVIHTKHDKATKAARFFNRVPFVGLFVPNSWGAMGAKGYRGNDERVINLDLSRKLKSHSDFFDDDNLDWYMPELLDIISTKSSYKELP